MDNKLEVALLIFVLLLIVVFWAFIYYLNNL